MQLEWLKSSTLCYLCSKFGKHQVKDQLLFWIFPADCRQRGTPVSFDREFQDSVAPRVPPLGRSAWVI